MKLRKLIELVLAAGLACGAAIASAPDELVVAADDVEAMAHSIEALPAALLGGRDRVVVAVQSKVQKPAKEVEVTGRCHTYVGRFRNNPNWTLRLLEMQIKGAQVPGVGWSVWEASGRHPHDLQVREAGDELYLVYGTNLGLRLLRLAESVDSATARQRLLRGERAVGEIAPITYSLLRESVGADPFLGKNALHWIISVRDLALVGGELRIVIQGVNPEPTFTYALREGQWRFLQ